MPLRLRPIMERSPSPGNPKVESQPILPLRRVRVQGSVGSVMVEYHLPVLWLYLA